MDVELAAKQIPTSFQSTDYVLSHVKYSFIIGLGIFIILLPFCRSKKSFFDVIAARKVVSFLRFFVILACVSNCVLLHMYMTYGNPLYLHAELSYGNGDSWLYGYGRPIAGFAFIGLGMFGDMHPFPRILCMVGCGVQVFSDALSAYQVHDYYNQVRFHDAPNNGYSNNAFMVYYWRDISAIGLCTLTLLLAGLLTCIVGWCDPQLIHPSLISGREYDRYAVMHIMRDKRRDMEITGYAQRDAMGLLKSRKNNNNNGNAVNNCTTADEKEEMGENDKKDEDIENPNDNADEKDDIDPVNPN